MDDFDCTAAGAAIADYVEELSNWYVRLSRRRFWEGDRAGARHPAPLPARGRGAAGALHPVPGRRDLRQPGRRGGEQFGELPDSVHLRDFPEPDPSLIDAELERAMEAVRRTVELGRAARAESRIKMRQPLRRAVVVASGAEREAISERAEPGRPRSST